MTLPPLPFHCPRPLEAVLRGAYADPPRAYHTFEHVEEVLGHMASVSHWQDPVAVALAILFHDAIYVAGCSDNEPRSAQLAAALIAAHLPTLGADVPRVEQLILLTARHGRLSRGDVDAEAACFLDCDMAVLGAEPERFVAYERAIAEEYSAVPADLYRAGRAQFLRSVLAKPHIYLSEAFAERYEARARENLTRALAAIASEIL